MSVNRNRLAVARACGNDQSRSTIVDTSVVLAVISLVESIGTAGLSVRFAHRQGEKPDPGWMHIAMDQALSGIADSAGRSVTDRRHRSATAEAPASGQRMKPSTRRPARRRHAVRKASTRPPHAAECAGLRTAAPLER
jgi:hypothetical protein